VGLRLSFVLISIVSAVSYGSVTTPPVGSSQTQTQIHAPAQAQIQAQIQAKAHALAQAQANQVATYPAVILSHGPVEIINSDGLPPSLTPGTRLRGNLEVKTGVSGSLRIQLDVDRALFIEPQTTIRIPGIAWESGELAEIYLVEGRIRLRSANPGKYSIRLTSALFDQPWQTGDILYEMDPKESLVRAYVLEGHLKFSALNGETSVELASGQKVTFQGQKEDGEIAYDILLQGRKVPRGLLGAVTSISPDELKLWDLAEELNKKKKMASAVQKNKQLEEQMGPGQICRKPKAKFNECAWVCINNRPGEKKRCLVQARPLKGGNRHSGSQVEKSTQCARLRCLAHGEWGDSKVLDMDEATLRCSSEPTVAPCDY
jgi:hypothetical protein